MHNRGLHLRLNKCAIRAERQLCCLVREGYKYWNRTAASNLAQSFDGAIDGQTGANGDEDDRQVHADSVGSVKRTSGIHGDLHIDYRWYRKTIRNDNRYVNRSCGLLVNCDQSPLDLTLGQPVEARRDVLERDALDVRVHFTRGKHPVEIGRAHV